ncbi:MAG: thiamine-phosphate kinase [Candidatus Omnitrophota bacterium]
MDSYLGNIKECRFIHSLASGAKITDPSVVKGIGDDTAVVRGPGNKYWLFTVDMLAESVHFKKGEDLKKVGYKAMAVSVSDIASMGGLPRYALVSAGFPRQGFQEKARRLMSGLRQCASRYGISIIGGDTNRSDKLVVDVFLAGEVEQRRLVLRGGGRKGDVLFVTGRLGGSQSGRHLCFQPRVRQARFLTAHFKVRAMIDLSDGLALDASRLAEACRLGVILFEEKIPLHPDAAGLKSALTDGEDYELLFALSSKDAGRLNAAASSQRPPLRFIPVGVLTDQFRGVRLQRRDGVVRGLPGPSFSHF